MTFPQNIGVIGSGIMGQGIGVVAAASGCDVLIYDLDGAAADAGLKKINAILAKHFSGQNLGSIRIAAGLGEMKDRGLIIEAVPEIFKTKAKLFADLDKICFPDAIFASNTSTILISRLAQTTRRSDRFVGMHFINPAFLMPLIEIVRGEKTSDATIGVVTALAQKFGKKPIVVNDSPGFVLNRLLLPMINEAVYCYNEKVASKEAIDSIMKLGTKHPLGPLELADLIGLDTCLYILLGLERGFGDPKYTPCPLFKKKVKENKLGRKTGEGFYKYNQ